MIRSIEIANFKSYEHAILPLAPLTVLIGANASGKSNAIEAIRLISWLAQGQKLSSIQYAVNQGDRVVRGTVQKLPREGEKTFTLGCELEAFGWSNWLMSIETRSDGLHISDESLTSPSPSAKVPLYKLDQPSTGHATDVGVAYNNFAKGGKKPHITCSDQLPIFSQLTSPATFAATHRASRRVIPETTKALESTLSSIMFLDPSPQAMRGYSFPADHRLVNDGSNLSAVLYNLCGSPDDSVTIGQLSDGFDDVKSAPALISLIQSLPEQAITGIRFIREPRGGVMVALLETFGGEEKSYDASLLSDGTLRVLSIGAALLSASEGSLVIIEEIDNGVHPSRAKHLLRSISEVAKARNLKVLLSTHNPALLDALPNSAIGSVVFCYRDPVSGSSRLVRLEDTPRFPELISQGSLGHLLTEGLIERFVKDVRTSEEKKSAALIWLRKQKERRHG